MRHLHNKDNFKAMMADMIEIIMQKDIKAVAGRVDLVEGAHKDISRYTFQLHQNCLVQA